jgi:hypothetical protein
MIARADKDERKRQLLPGFSSTSLLSLTAMTLHVFYFSLPPSRIWCWPCTTSPAIAKGRAL